jgi:hypothetical protein
MSGRHPTFFKEFLPCGALNARRASNSPGATPFAHHLNFCVRSATGCLFLAPNGFFDSPTDRAADSLTAPELRAFHFLEISSPVAGGRRVSTGHFSVKVLSGGRVVQKWEHDRDLLLEEALAFAQSVVRLKSVSVEHWPGLSDRERWNRRNCPNREIRSSRGNTTTRGRLQSNST